MNMPGMSQRWINIDLLTTEYRIVGRALVGNTGLHGLLCDKTRSYVDVRDAQIAYIRQPMRVVQRYESVNIIKDRIYVANMERREIAGPTSVAHRSYTDYLRYPLHISFGGFEMDCYIEWTGRFDMGALIADKMGGYLLVYNALLESAVFSDLTINTPAAFVNMSRVDLVALTPATERSKSPHN